MSNLLMCFNSSKGLGMRMFTCHIWTKAICEWYWLSR